MSDKLQFNISASSLSSFEKSPIQFYFEQILKSEPDTESYECYGRAGTLVHDFLERNVKGEEFYDVDMMFHQEWKEKKLDELKGINGKTLDINLYLNAVKLGLFKLKELYKEGRKSEEELIIPFINNDDVEINLKGYIDLTVTDNNGNVIIIDWKTNSSVEDFSTAAKMYFLLYYKKYGILPTKAVYEYLKISKDKPYKFTLQEILDFEEEVKSKVLEIIKHKDDIEWFELGDWDNIFNQYKKACFKEFLRRNNSKTINVRIKNNILTFEGLNDSLRGILDKKYSYFVEGYSFSEKYKKRQWDGKKHLFKKDTLPIGFKEDAIKFFNDYNKYFQTNYKLEFVDERVKPNLKQYDEVMFKPSDKILRDYQEDSVNKAIEKKVGILEIATGLGKTFIASEVIRRLKKRTLFLINRIELVTQTKEMFEEELGVEIGVMAEGNLNISKMITVASVQTIYSILKNRSGDERNLLLKYLYNVEVVVYDECHGVSESVTYDILKKTLVNADYIIGLSATPFRNDGSTLDMNGFLGTPIVKYDTKFGEENGYLCPTKTLFVRHDFVKGSKDNSYHENYDLYVTNNKERNELVKKIVEKHKGQKILIITKIIDHAYVLQGMIPQAEIINSSVDMKKRKQSMKDFKSSKDGFIMIAGIKIVGTGLNVPDLDVIINVCANKSDNDTIQVIGRVKRMFEGKEFGYYYDFADRGFLFKTTKYRLNILKEYGNEPSYIEVKELYT